MTRDNFDFSQIEPDIVEFILQKCIAMAPGFSAALAAQIEQEVKATHGGKRLFIPKGAKRLTPEEKAQVFQDGLSNMSNEEIKSKHKISIRTLQRYMKTGGRFSN
jgi:Mor family transcriptional regulator